MDYKTWFNQTWPNAFHRTFGIGRRKSARTLNKSGAPLDYNQNETIQGLWKYNSPSGLFEDTALHKELDRLMERMRLS